MHIHSQENLEELELKILLITQCYTLILHFYHDTTQPVFIDFTLRTVDSYEFHEL